MPSFEPGDFVVKVRRPGRSAGAPRFDVYVPDGRPLIKPSKKALREAVLRMRSNDRKIDPAKGPHLKIKRVDSVHELERQKAWEQRLDSWERRKYKWELGRSDADLRLKITYEAVEPLPVRRVRVLKVLLWNSEAENIGLALRKIEGELEAVLPTLFWNSRTGGNAGRYGSFPNRPPRLEPVYADQRTL